MTDFKEHDLVMKDGDTYSIVTKYYEDAINNDGNPVKYRIRKIKNKTKIPLFGAYEFDVPNLNGYTKVNSGGRRRTHKRSKKARKSRKARRRHHH